MALSSHKGTLVTLAIVVGVLVWNYNRPDQQPVREVKRPVPQLAASPPPSPVEPPPPYTSEVLNPPVHPVPALPGVTSPAPATTAPPVASVLPGSVSEIPVTAEEIAEDLSAVDATIRNFQAVHGGNPIGSNAEITAALLGNNPKQIKLEVPAGSRINSEGQMCDRWGTPYFFHQVSATEMEIRSAGPDRQMWTGDDSKM